VQNDFLHRHTQGQAHVNPYATRPFAAKGLETIRGDANLAAEASEAQSLHRKSA